MTVGGIIGVGVVVVDTQQVFATVIPGSFRAYDLDPGVAVLGKRVG